MNDSNQTTSGNSKHVALAILHYHICISKFYSLKESDQNFELKLDRYFLMNQSSDL